MKCVARVLLSLLAGLLAGCAALSSQPPITPGQSVQLQPGDGIAALLMDTQDPLTQVLVVSTDDKAPDLDLPSMPSGRTLALFAVPAGVYCLKDFSFGIHRFHSKTLNVGCFQVTAGHISYSGNLKPAAGRDPATGKDGAVTEQTYEPDVFLNMLKKQYPQLMSAYPTAGPETANDGVTKNDITRELATWTVEAADHRSYDVFLRNNANWTVTLTKFEFTKCSNIKQHCGAQAVGMTIPPNTTIKYMVVEQADSKQAYEFQYIYNHASVNMGSKQ